MTKKCRYGKVKGTKRCKTKTQFVSMMQKGRAKSKRKKVSERYTELY